MSSRARGFTILELIVVICIVALLFSILLPSIGRARELARQLAEESGQAASAPAETEEMAEAREAAQDMAEELEIDGRVRAISEEYGLGGTVEATVLVDHPEGSDAPAGARRRRVSVMYSTDGLPGISAEPVVSVSIDGAVVYTSVDGDVRKYLGGGEWETALDRVLWQVREAREEQARRERQAEEKRFRLLRETRYGPLPFPTMSPEQADAADPD